MPSGITTKDGMMYVGETPWHRQGVRLDNPATAAEAISAAGLDWTVIKKPVYVRDESGSFRMVEGKEAIVREDTNTIFTIMGKGYEPAQNNTCFDMFNAVTGTGEAIYHTAGSLFGGRRIFVLAKLPNDIEVVPGDVVQPYILLSNSHDGSQALRMQITPIRVVCWNTLSAALHRNGGFYARHTRNIMQRANEAREVLGLAHAYYELFARQIDELVNTRMTVVEVQDYLQRVYQFRDDRPYAKQDHRVLKAYETTMDLLSHPTNTLGGIQGTKWATFNAVSYYVDHERIVRAGQYKEDRRLDASWFGTGAALRQRAYDLLTT
jgi:phage/plasmid-like protein (TIGR03299 family)